jgi:hypothetical protein
VGRDAFAGGQAALIDATRNHDCGEPRQTAGGREAWRDALLSIRVIVTARGTRGQSRAGVTLRPATSDRVDHWSGVNPPIGKNGTYAGF